MAHDQNHYRDANEDPAHLRAEIRETRDRMSETLDQLGTRLNPNRIKAQVRENIREATVGRVENMARHATDRVNETREGILDTIRDNPIPAAMIGIGLGWMIFNGKRRGESHASSGGHRLYGSSEFVGDISATTPRLQQDDAAGGLGASVSHHDQGGVIEHVRSGIATVGDTAGSVVEGARERLSGVKDGAQERISDVAQRVQYVASDVRETTRVQAHRIEERVSRTFEDNPLALGAVALAVGMAAGFAVPSSEREHQLMGAKRDQLMDRVREAAEETREKVQHVAERVIDETRQTAKEAAKDEGLVS